MRSHVLEGTVSHRRTRPFRYELSQGVYMVALDLSELGDLDRHFRLLGRRRRSILRFADADHLPGGSRDVDADIREHLRRGGEDPAGWSIVLVTSPRVLGYVFNPASFYLCRDAEGVLRIVVVEVHNTFGERHLYTLRSENAAGPPGSAPFRAGMAKAFYVSPFISLDGRYRVTVRDDGQGLRIAIDLRQDDRPLLATSLILERRPLTDRVLLRMLLRYPLATHRTIAAIHWHAFRLWLRGARFHRHAGWADRLVATRQAPIEAAARPERLAAR